MVPGTTEQILAHSLPAIYILNLTTFAQKHGIDPALLLQSAGLSMEALSEPGRRIPAIQAMQIYMALVAAYPREDLGMQLGLGTRITNLGLVGFGLMSCANMREAGLLNIRHLPILAPMMRLRLEESGGEAIFTHSCVVDLGPLRQRIFDQFMFEGITNTMFMMHEADGPELLKEVDLYFTCPEQAYLKAFSPNIHHMYFNCAEDQIRFPLRHLDKPLRSANPTMARTIADLCDEQMALLGLTGNWIDRVKAQLNCQHDGYPQLSKIAATLETSERNLKRHLQQAGSSYSELLTEARHRDAKNLLAVSPQPVDVIASRLGYLNPANFTRAFKRWTGMTPSSYRHEQWSSRNDSYLVL